jgi:hypothetical protein
MGRQPIPPRIAPSADLERATRRELFEEGSRLESLQDASEDPTGISSLSRLFGLTVVNRGTGLLALDATHPYATANLMQSSDCDKKASSSAD